MADYILVCVAWPYANGSQHLGHIAGNNLPADIFARYHRAKGDHVLMVSGSDMHGTPITVRAEKEGRTPLEVAQQFHEEFLRTWEALGISYDLYTTTTTDNHREVVWNLYRRLLEAGHLYRAKTQQLYDPKAGRFLPDRYVEGTCPRCGFGQARGDECEQCGATLDAVDLIEPRSRLTGVKPELRETEHYFMRFSAFQDRLIEWVKGQTHWRDHVRNFTLGFLAEGLKDRAITRDLEWGIPMPPEMQDIGPGKAFYVWAENIVGYLSASVEWAIRRGTPDAWKDWWTNPDARAYYFMGKDNITFHTINWPAMLMGHGGLNLPYDVPANHYVVWGGAKASKSAGVAPYALDYAERFGPDAVRYYLAAVMPESSDTDVSDEDLIRRNNDELVATWGNLVHRVLTFTYRNFEGRVPEAGALSAREEALLQRAAAAIRDAGEHLERCRFKAALGAAMGLAQDANRYLDEAAPWKTIREDRSAAGRSLYVALALINACKVALCPFLPFSAQRLHEFLGFEGRAGTTWEFTPVPAGQALREPEPLFRKIEAADTTS